MSVVLCAIGGNHSNELVDLLDYELIRSHPKVFQGLSDITVLHCAMQHHAGLATFYGPALVTNLAEYPSVFEMTDRCVRAAWFGDAPIEYAAATEWTDEFLNFGTQDDLTRPRKLQPGSGWLWLHPGSAQGPIARWLPRVAVLACEGIAGVATARRVRAVARAFRRCTVAW